MRTQHMLCKYKANDLKKISFLCWTKHKIIFLRFEGPFSKISEEQEDAIYIIYFRKFNL